MLKERKFKLVMIGHSEGRHVFGERTTRKTVSKASLNHGFQTLLCNWRTGEQKEYGVSAEILRTQLMIGFHGVSKDQIGKIWVA